MKYTVVLPESHAALVFVSNDGDRPRAEPAFARAASVIAGRRGWGVQQ